VITEHDLKEAIAECQGVREPNANTCIKLAAYYTILEHIQEQDNKTEMQNYSYSSAPISAPYSISYDGESEFAHKIDGMNSYKVLDIMNELMETISVLNPALYNSVMRKLSE
jgi:hypothetical protein